jgi:hypothetical protein
VPQTHRIQKTVNKLKATKEKREGPARKSQDTAPIADAIAAFWERNALSFGIPAHGGGREAGPVLDERFVDERPRRHPGRGG